MLFSSIHINCSLFFCSSVIKLCYQHKVENFAWQKKFKILHHLVQYTSQGLLSVLACISERSRLFSWSLFIVQQSLEFLVIWSVALSPSLQAEARHLAGQASSVERECSRLERDLEEGSRRLAMAHSEIRRLTDELESAHLTQRAYGERY